MKTLMISALVASLAAPAFAADSDYIHLDNERGSGSRIYLKSAPETARASELFATLAAEDNGSGSKIYAPAGDINMSTKGGVNARAQVLFDQLAAEEGGDER